MDWSKAKNVLIAAFIVTNLFLIYNIQRDLFGPEEVQLINDIYITNVETYLKDHDIILQADIPKEVVSLPILVVKYKTFDPEKIAKQFLGDGYERQNIEGKKGQEEYIYTKEAKELTVESNKRIKYKNNSEKKVNYVLDEKAVVEISDEFLNKHKLMRNDLKLEQIYYGFMSEYDEEPIYQLIYHQTYKKKFLGESYIHVYINHRGVVGLDAMLLEYERTQQSRKKVVPATEALARAMDMILKDNNEEEIIVKNIDLGYYFSPADYVNSDWKEVESGTAFPSWRITLQNGKTYFIEAYKN